LRLPRPSLAGVKAAIRKRWRTLAFIVACLLAFAGPYGTYLLYKLDLPWPAPDLVGFALLAVGLILVAYLLAPKREEGSSQEL